MTKLQKIFEANSVSGHLTLKKTEDLNDQQFQALLGIKPGEINIILSRVVAFIKNEGGEKTRKDLLNDILEVLERSAVARKFVGIGILDEYNLFRGFPVRRGDPYERMPGQNEELILHPSDAYLTWSTNATSSREDSTKFDAAKGEPIGGLVVQTHVDPTKLLFDMNAVPRAIKAKLQQILHYNLTAAPGKALSKSNIDYLGNNAPEFHGDMEISTPNSIVNTRVLDKWTWDETSGQKQVKWTEPANNVQEPKKPEEPAETTPNPQQAPEKPVQQTLPAIKEMFSMLDESDEYITVTEWKTLKPEKLPVDDSELNEAAMDKLKGVVNWISKTAKMTTRGKTLHYLDLLVKQFEARKEVYELAKQYSELLDEDATRIEHADKQIEILNGLIENAKEALAHIEEHSDSTLDFTKGEKELFRGSKKDLLKKKDKAPVTPQPKTVKQVGDLSKFVKESKKRLDEGIVQIFDKLMDVSLSSRKPITRKKLEKLFSNLSNAIEKSNGLRLKTLEAQATLLHDQIKDFENSRFAKHDAVVKLKKMYETTLNDMSHVHDLQTAFHKAKDQAIDFAFNDEDTDLKLNKKLTNYVDKVKAHFNQTLPEDPEKDPVEKHSSEVVNDIDDLEAALEKLPSGPDVDTSAETKAIPSASDASAFDNVTGEYKPSATPDETQAVDAALEPNAETEPMDVVSPEETFDLKVAEPTTDIEKKFNVLYDKHGDKFVNLLKLQTEYLANFSQLHDILAKRDEPSAAQDDRKKYTSQAAQLIKITKNLKNQIDADPVTKDIGDTKSLGQLQNFFVKRVDALLDKIKVATQQQGENPTLANKFKELSALKPIDAITASAKIDPKDPVIQAFDERLRDKFINDGFITVGGKFVDVLKKNMEGFDKNFDVFKNDEGRFAIAKKGGPLPPDTFKPVSSVVEPTPAAVEKPVEKPIEEPVPTPVAAEEPVAKPEIPVIAKKAPGKKKAPLKAGTPKTDLGKEVLQPDIKGLSPKKKKELQDKGFFKAGKKLANTIMTDNPGQFKTYTNGKDTIVAPITAKAPEGFAEPLATPPVTPEPIIPKAAEPVAPTPEVAPKEPVVAAQPTLMSVEQFINNPKYYNKVKTPEFDGLDTLLSQKEQLEDQIKTIQASPSINKEIRIKKKNDEMKALEPQIQSRKGLVQLPDELIPVAREAFKKYREDKERDRKSRSDNFATASSNDTTSLFEDKK